MTNGDGLKCSGERVRQAPLAEEGLVLSPTRYPGILKIEHDRQAELLLHHAREQHWIEWASGEENDVRLVRIYCVSERGAEMKISTKANITDASKPRQGCRPGTHFDDIEFRRQQACEIRIEALFMLRFVDAEDDRTPSGGRQVFGEMAGPMHARERARWKMGRDDKNASMHHWREVTGRKMTSSKPGSVTSLSSSLVPL